MRTLLIHKEMDKYIRYLFVSDAVQMSSNSGERSAIGLGLISVSPYLFILVRSSHFDLAGSFSRGLHLFTMTKEVHD